MTNEELEVIESDIRVVIQGAIERESMYGEFCGGDPRNFAPDPKCSTDEERAAHRAAHDGVSAHAARIEARAKVHGGGGVNLKKLRALVPSWTWTAKRHGFGWTYDGIHGERTVRVYPMARIVNEDEFVTDWRAGDEDFGTFWCREQTKSEAES